MATRSNIGYYEDGIYTNVYCHWDGYPSHNGIILFNNYNTIEKVKELISFGEISSLDNTLGECCFYHRDRDEDLTIEKESYDNINDIPTKQSYEYIFFEDKWYIRCYSDKIELLENILDDLEIEKNL